MGDHYNTLGVDKNATQEEIKKAYRKLASLHHPDKGGDTTKFQDIQTAYDTIGNVEKRHQYDNPTPNHTHFNNHRGFDYINIFNMFGEQAYRQAAQQQTQTRMKLWITLHDVAKGGKRSIGISNAHGSMNIEIEIPKGINDGDNIQYKELGPNKTDLIITFCIHPTPKWQRKDLHLITEHQVSIWDCLVGGESEIKDILEQPYLITIPPLTHPGAILRLKNKGLTSCQGQTGDLLIKIQAKMPDTISYELSALIKKAQEK
jgi:DnaJ-class molecular chaperone